MQETDFKDFDEPSPETKPRRFGLRTLNRRAIFSLAMGMLLTSVELYREPPSISGVAILVGSAGMIFFEGALLYGILSAGLWAWRLITHNRHDKPLWNWIATVAVLVGLSFAIFAVLFTLYGPVPPNPEMFASTGVGVSGFMAILFVAMFTVVACMSYGMGSAWYYIRRGRKAAQGR